MSAEVRCTASLHRMRGGRPPRCARSRPTAPCETLDQAWHSALANDPALQATHERVQAATADLDAARAQRYPSVTASAGVTRFETTPAFDFARAGVPVQLPLFEGADFWTADARLTVPLYTAGMIGHGIAAAQAGLDARSRAAQSAAQDLKLAVARPSYRCCARRARWKWRTPTSPAWLRTRATCRTCTAPAPCRRAMH